MQLPTKEYAKVTAHHEDLLEQAAGVGELSGSLQTVREGIDALDSSLEKCALTTYHHHPIVLIGWLQTASKISHPLPDYASECETLTASPASL